MKTHAIRRAPMMLCVIFLSLFHLGLFAGQSPESTSDDSLYWSAQEYIRSFDVDMEVDVSGMLTVTERITIHALGREFRRGLVRTIPTSRMMRHGIRKRMDFHILDIKKDGATEPFFTEEKVNERSIYIGREHVMLSPGMHTYTITYQTKGHVGFFDGYDELYWNVTGDQWNFMILQASATFRLPNGSSVLQQHCYTGPADDSGHACSYTVNPDGTLHIQTTEKLNQREGFAVAVGFTPGIIKRPGRLAGFYDDYHPYVLAVLLLILLSWYYYSLWKRHGRDPIMPTIIAQYEPPRQLSPAKMRYLFKRVVDDKAFATALINMAVKKKITIKVPKTKAEAYTISKKDESTEGLSVDETAVFNKLLRSRKTIRTTHGNGHIFRSAKSALKDTITKHIDIKDYFLKNTKQMVWGFLAMLAAIIIYSVVEAREMDLVFLFVVPFVVIGGIMLIGGIRALFTARLVGLVFMLFGLVFGGVPLVVLFYITGGINYVFLSFLLLCIGLYLLFIYLIKAPTPAGSAMLSEILGFKMYLEVVEEHKLNLLNPPTHTPELFERFLPYAMALDVENKWSEKFKDELAELDYTPEWYSGSTNFQVGALTGSMLAGFTGAINPAPPSSSGSSGSSSWSSGSSGGGSSSGGGGGGGGGGW